MRSTFVVFAIIAAASVTAAAKNLGDWNRVQHLKSGDQIRVVDTSGATADGRLSAVTVNDLVFDAHVSGVGGLLSPRKFARGEVREVYKLGKDFNRRLSGRDLVIASAAGLAVGIGIGAAVDQAHPSSEDPGQGTLIGGVLGVFIGPAALAVGRAVISATHRTKLIYRAPQNDPHVVRSSVYASLRRWRPASLAAVNVRSAMIAMRTCELTQ